MSSVPLELMTKKSRNYKILYLIIIFKINRKIYTKIHFKKLS